MMKLYPLHQMVGTAQAQHPLSSAAQPANKKVLRNS